MRKQGTVIPVETIVSREVIGKIPVKAQRPAKNLVGDIARRENDVQVALRDRESLTVGERIAERSGGTEPGCGTGLVERLTLHLYGRCDGSVRARRAAGRGAVIGQEPWSLGNCEVVPDMEPGEELLLEGVSVPFQLC